MNIHGHTKSQASAGLCSLEQAVGLALAVDARPARRPLAFPVMDVAAERITQFSPGLRRLQQRLEASLRDMELRKANRFPQLIARYRHGLSISPLDLSRDAGSNIRAVEDCRRTLHSGRRGPESKPCAWSANPECNNSRNVRATNSTMPRSLLGRPISSRRMEISTPTVSTRRVTSRMPRQSFSRPGTTSCSIAQKLYAPVRGIVPNVRFATIGAVLRPGGEVLHILPMGDDLIFEAKVKRPVIAFLQPGLAATVKIDTHDFSIYGGVKGTVTYIGRTRSARK